MFLESANCLISPAAAQSVAEVSLHSTSCPKISHPGDAAPSFPRRAGTVAAISALLALAFLYPTTSARASEIHGSLSIATEYDDNINHSNDSAKESDFVLRLRPIFEARFPLKTHSFSLAFDGDYRDGLETGLTDLNFSSSADLDLDFPGGLGLHLTKTYDQRRFDQTLTEQPDTEDNDTDLFQTVVSYVFVERLRGELTHKLQRQDFDIDEFRFDRDTESLEGLVFVPLTRKLESYFSYSIEDSDSRQRPDRTFEREGYRVGVSWKGPSRFLIWLEAGQETLDFDSTSGEDFDHSVAELGAEIDFSDFTDGELVVGRDGFGKLEFSAELSYQNDRDFDANLSVSQTTQTSFSFVFANRVFQTRKIDLQLADTFAERIVVSLSLGFHHQESLPFRDDHDQVVHGKIQADYPLRERLELSARYQYSRRQAAVETVNFRNHRLGLVATFTY